MHSMPEFHVSQKAERRRFWLSASVVRTLLETLVLSGLICSILSFVPSPLIGRQIWLIGLVGPLCMLFYILRLRFLPMPWSCRHVLDGMLALGVGVLLGLITPFYLSRMYESLRPNLSPYDIGLRLGALSVLADWAVYVIVRLGLRLLRSWNRLRRRHLIWALTNSHVLLVASVAGFFILFIDVVLISMAESRSLWAGNLLLVVPLTLLLLVPSCIAMLLIVPPFALFSYFVIRRATDRLHNLMFATSALRAGKYSVRVRVEGEDEVAQLQHDFNAMAADLEQTMHDLQEERDRVAKLLQERRDMIANVSHELRTPVATMRGYLEAALMHWDDMSLPRLQEDMRVMEGEAIQLQARVEDLFTLARADVGMLKLQMVPTDAAELVRRIVDARAPLAWRSSRIEVVADIASDLPLVMADPNRLSQVLQNLLHNALRHTTPGGIVALVLTATHSDIIFQIKDTGEGIAPQDLPHIWERFYQTASARTRVGSGTGLGLALVKEWIEGMHGSVSAESEPGQGSCFTLCLPLASCALHELHQFEQLTQPMRVVTSTTQTPKIEP